VLGVPPVALRLGLGRQLADELLLGSLRVLPARLIGAGYRFRDPVLEGALAEAIRR
jgi:NAD dependent epimerase/dehydratase family enzyme